MNPSDLEAIRARVRKMGIPMGSDDPTLVALGAPCIHAWHEARVVKRADECPACHEQNSDGSRW